MRQQPQQLAYNTQQLEGNSRRVQGKRRGDIVALQSERVNKAASALGSRTTELMLSVGSAKPTWTFEEPQPLERVMMQRRMEPIYVGLNRGNGRRNLRRSHLISGRMSSCLASSSTMKAFTWWVRERRYKEISSTSSSSSTLPASELSNLKTGICHGPPIG